MLRSQPWLGTYVTIYAQGNNSATNFAIQSAFNEVAQVHKSMSFHNPCSELSDLNRLANQRPVNVSARLYRVLRAALVLAKSSDGYFDPTLAGRMVQDGLLPSPNANAVNVDANWRDIKLVGGNTVEFLQPLWLDLSGIAKGYAVDLAIRSLMKNGVTAAAVNAGGDLRVYGRQQRISVRDPSSPGEQIPLLEIENGAVATSANYFTVSDDANFKLYDIGLQDYQKKIGSTTVTARYAIWADALTKIVAAQGKAALPLLKRLNASAMMIDGNGRRVLIN